MEATEITEALHTVQQYAHPYIWIGTKNTKYELAFDGKDKPLAVYGVSTRMTLAYNASKDGIDFGASFCSTNDNFSRKTGRNIAENRLKNTPFFIPMPNAHIQDRHTILNAIYNSLEMNMGQNSSKLIGIPHSWIWMSFKPAVLQ